jgi:hypothetical protein
VIDDDRWIFEIAVYRVSEDDWLDDIERRIEHRKATLRRDPDADEADLKHAESMERRPGWQYNEVVAWIRIKVDGDMLKAYSWRVPRQRFQRGFTPFPFEGGMESKLFELWRDDFEDSSEVYARLRSELVVLIDRGHTHAGRHLDLRVFDAIGPHIDWRALF